MHTQTTDVNNEIFKVAADLINKTDQHIFLTGKAGTGKTTFLRHIKEHTSKQCVVVAPTGVAAINAGGVTMHSLFQLPFTPFIPTYVGFDELTAQQVTDKHSLFRNIRFGNDKRNLFNRIELLIIDEVSMVRADMLDAVDTILRQFRNNKSVPFGGIQVLYIGDLFQLPPVVKDHEWQVLQNYYKSPFFFDSKVINEKPPLNIELTTIYRQTDAEFIDLLNNVRNNKSSADDLSKLNSLYHSGKVNSNAIVLTTHNYIADSINTTELNKLAGPSYIYKGIIEGDFNDKILPIDLNLELKVGAKVMFVRNDTNKRYYNGKLATIAALTADDITVAFDDDQEIYTLEREEWKNIRYKLNDNNEIEEEELGSFTQFPLRLAWAITIHKSQGLTFDEVVIDAGQSFAAGQVYVALSRCTGMKGITLRSVITPQSIRTDERILAFSSKTNSLEQLQNVLRFEKETFLAAKLKSFFNFDDLQSELFKYKQLVADKQLPDKQEAIQLSNDLITACSHLVDVANKFQPHLDKLLIKVHTDRTPLYQKVQSGIDYFTKEIIEKLLKPLQLHLTQMAKANKVKQYIAGAKKTEKAIWEALVNINSTYYDDDVFAKNLEAIQVYNPSIATVLKKEKPVKGETYEITYKLYLEGKSIAEIAAERGLAISTIEGHLARQVRLGKVKVDIFVNSETLALITEAIQKDGGHATTPIKALLPDYITHSQIRAVLNHLDYIKEQNENKN